MSDSTQTWPTPRPIEDTQLPDFPTHIFPTWFEDYAQAVAHQESAPYEFPIAVAWAVIGTVLQRSARAASPDGHEQSTNVYAVIVAPPSSSKSGTMKPMLAPLREIERERADRDRTRVLQACEEFADNERRIKVLETRCATRADEEAGAELARLREKRDAVDARSLVVPRMLADDVTPEALATLMVGAGGALALFADEGSILAHVRGAYSPNPNIALFLKAYDGREHMVDRRGRVERIERPTLTLCLMVQPSKIEGIESADGLLARFRYFCPNVNVGYRDRSLREPIPAHIVESYHAGIRRLADRWLDAPQVSLMLSRSAHVRMAEWRQAIEIERRPGGRLDGSEGFSEWTGKDGECLRLAAQLHALDGLDETKLIDVVQVEKAIVVMEVLTEHARKVRDSAPNESSANKWGRKVLDWLRSPVREDQHTSFTSAQLARYLGCKPNQRPVHDAALEQLEGLGWLRAGPAKRGDSCVWIVNPHVWSDGKRGNR